VLVRESLAAHGAEKVKGLVIVDWAPERAPLPPSWPALLGPSIHHSVIGLEASRAVSDTEWATIKADEEAKGPAAAIEEAYMKATTDAVNTKIRGKRLLGDGQLSVVVCNESVDFEKVYAFGVEHGYGSAEEREALRKRLVEYGGRWMRWGQRTHLDLALGNARFAIMEGEARTHNVHGVRPDLVGEEVRWVLGLPWAMAMG
jgi:hypothetical protein